MNLLNRIRAVYERDSLSPAVRDLLDQEEIQGARTANRFRYVFCLLMSVSIYINTTNISGIGIMINYGTMAAYFLATIAHTIVLRRHGRIGVIIFSYLSVVLDFLIILFALFAWYQIAGRGDYAFLIKNPTYYFLYIPLAVTLFQFRLRLVIFATVLFMIIYYGIMLYGMAYHDLAYGADWYSYVLGRQIVVPDIMTTRPMLFLIFALAIGYTIYRTMLLTRRVGEVEGQKQNLSRYFSPDVAAEISSQPEVLNHGARQKVTILFSDIRNFTAMSEGMNPAEISDFLSELRRRLTNAIFEHGGTLDKYIGDAVMATFGTPRPDPEPGADSRAALRAGVAMQRELAAYNEERRAAGLPEIAIGIGLHTGEVFAGNVGFEGRMEYTVIGDAVNTASRIESLCKKLDRTFLISDAVYQEAGSIAPTEEMPRVKVKGKTEPLKLYAVQG